MQQNRWNRIQELFAACVDLPACEQSTFLESNCGEDRELLNEVQSLLEYDSAKSDTLSIGVLRAAKSLLRSNSSTARRRSGSGLPRRERE